MACLLVVVADVEQVVHEFLVWFGFVRGQRPPLEQVDLMFRSSRRLKHDVLLFHHALLVALQPPLPLERDQVLEGVDAH